MPSRCGRRVSDWGRGPTAVGKCVGEAGAGVATVAGWL